MCKSYRIILDKKCVCVNLSDYFRIVAENLRIMIKGKHVCAGTFFLEKDEILQKNVLIGFNGVNSSFVHSNVLLRSKDIPVKVSGKFKTTFKLQRKCE